MSPSMFKHDKVIESKLKTGPSNATLAYLSAGFQGSYLYLMIPLTHSHILGLNPVVHKAELLQPYSFQVLSILFYLQHSCTT